MAEWHGFGLFFFVDDVDGEATVRCFGRFGRRDGWMECDDVL